MARSFRYIQYLLWVLVSAPAFAQAPNGSTPWVVLHWGNSSAINTVAVSPNGRQAVSGGYDNVLKLWDLSTGLLLRSFDGEADKIGSIAFSADGTAILAAAGKAAKLWKIRENLISGASVLTFAGHLDIVSSAVFSPDGHQVLSGSKDKTLKLWDVATGQELKTFNGHSDEVMSVAFSPDGRHALSGSKDKTLKLWDVATGQELKTFNGHSDEVMSVAFSPDGRQALSGSKDKSLKLWNVATGQELKTFNGHSSEVTSVVFSPDGRQALSGSKDKSLKLWNVATGQELKTFNGHSSEVTSVVFSPDGRNLLSASSDKTVKLWDGVTGQELKTLEAHADAATSAVFTPDGHQVVSGSWDKTLKIWSVETTQLLSSIDVTSSVFSPSGRYGYFETKPLPNTPDLTRLNERLSEKGFKRGDPVFLRVFKGEAQVELWMRRGRSFELFATYPICAWSGQLGPKIKEGDYQSPEGFYTIGKKQLNPNSRYHKAFNLGYPNAFDRKNQRTGANLMMHGACSSVGCYAMTDQVIDELWDLVTAALNNGQEHVGVHIFPFRMTDVRLAAFSWHPSADFWRDIKAGYDLFETSHVPPQVSVCDKRYAVKRGDGSAKTASVMQTGCLIGSP